ncbi:hypothetical protein [Methylotetracoccus oryzae]|nr:hypothetical protein [Methylotetracoccus oryzae]
MISHTIKLGALLITVCLLTACDREGPFGNTPGPKKPDWLQH